MKIAHTCELKLNSITISYVYWTMHRLDCWIKIDQLDVTCFIISLFTAQHVSNVSTSIFRGLRLIVDLFHVLYCSGSMCVGVTVWFGWRGVVSLCRLKLCFRLHKDIFHKDMYHYLLLNMFRMLGWSTRASACIRMPHHPSRTTP